MYEKIMIGNWYFYSVFKGAPEFTVGGCVVWSMLHRIKSIFSAHP